MSAIRRTKLFNRFGLTRLTVNQRSRIRLTMDHHDRSAAWHATAWRVFGAASVAIGIVNAFIPLLPTTVFLLIGAWAWGKGAPQWRDRLLAHPRWGEALRLWANGRQVSRRGKRMATLGIATNWLLSATWIGPTTAVLAVGLGLAALVAWLWCRPKPGSAPSSGNFGARDPPRAVTP